jgi:polysaccharide export outer membrane protein
VPLNLQFAINLLNEMGSAACAAFKRSSQPQTAPNICILLVLAAAVPSCAQSNLSATTTVGGTANRQEIVKAPHSAEHTGAPPNLESTEDWNQHLRERFASLDPKPSYNPQEYLIGSEDVLDINVFEAPEMNRDVRVSASGEISLPLLGAVAAAGFTPRELETSLEELLHQKYMKDPHVSVFVRDMQSHPVSVMGAVRKPGIFQIRGDKTLLEILSLAEGLADDAGEDVIILRRAGQKNGSEFLSANASGLAESSPVVRVQEFDEPGATDEAPDKAGAVSPEVVRVNLKDLLDSTDPRHNPAVYPGDIVKVSRAGIVYVVGAVQRPGGFAMKTNEKISVLQAIALSEGLTRTAAKGGARIIRTNEQNGARTETPIDLGKILSGKSQDPMLAPKDIVFVPDSAAKTAFTRGVEVATQTLTGLLVFHW